MKVFKAGPRLVVRHGKLPIIFTPTTIPDDVTIVSPSGSFTVGLAILFTGTVTPSGNPVQVALSDQNSTPPSDNLVSVVPNGGNWSQSITPSSAGTQYAWVIDPATGQTAVSGPLVVQDVVVASSVSVSAPIVNVIHPGDAVTVTGTVSPSGPVQYQVTTQNTSAPTGNWLDATSNTSGDWSATFTAGSVGPWYVWAKEPVSGKTAVSAAFTVTTATTSNVVIPFQVANAADATATDPYHLAGFAFGPGDVPAGYYPKVTQADGVTELTNYQWCAPNTRKGGDLRFAVLRMKAAGSYSAYGQAGFTNQYKVVPTPGTGPSGTAISLADIMARSNFEVRIYGCDYRSELANDSDYFVVNLNEILTSLPRDTAGWGANPIGGYRINWQGKLETAVMGWRFLKRKSDGANHKWVQVRIYAHALSGGEFEISARVIQGNMYGPHPTGTVGPDSFGQPNFTSTVPAQPRYAGFMEIWETKTNTYVGGWGGLREERQFTLPASAFDTTKNLLDTSSVFSAWPSPELYPVSRTTKGGPFPNGVGVLFQATSGSTLPSGIDPNRVYWFSNVPNRKVVLCTERASVLYSDSAESIPTGTNWTANAAGTFGTIVAVNNAWFLRMTTGTSGSSQPVLNSAPGMNATVTDGTIQLLQLTASFGNPGTGTIRVVPVAATFANTAIDLRDSYGKRYWFDPAGKPRPDTMPMPDFNYATTKSHVVPPFEYYTPNPVPPSRTFRYTPNQRFTMTGRQGGGAWDMARNPGESEDDFRLGQWAGWGALQLYQPSDRATVQNARTWASNFTAWTIWGVDERTGYPILSNKGPNRAGGDYPLFPPGTVNSNVYWTVVKRTGGGSPQPMALGNNETGLVYRHLSGFQYSYAGIGNGTHLANPGAPQYILDGEPTWADFCLQQACTVLTSYPAADRNLSWNGVQYGGLTSPAHLQPRGCGWDTCKMINAGSVTPDSSVMRQVIDNNLDDLSGALSIYADMIDSKDPIYRRWSITNIAVGDAQLGNAGLGSVWSYAHQWEGFSLGAWVAQKADGTSERPGFLKACNDWMPGINRFFDPNVGGCIYYLGQDLFYISSGPDIRATEFKSIAACMTSARMNPVSNSASTANLGAGQIIGGGFVCPGAGQSAPTQARINGSNPTLMTTSSDPNALDASWYPGVNFANQAGLGAPFKGIGYIDGQSFVMQMMAPLAVAARCAGSNPMFLRIWDLARARQNAPPNVGVTLVATGQEAPSHRVTDGFFMYAYTPH